MRRRKILITGSRGLVGTALGRALAPRFDVVGLDLEPRARDVGGDTRDRALVERLVGDVDGVVHLAAVSRVVWGERDPERCRTVNVDGTRNVLEAARRAPRSPWVLFASSREVYGQPDVLPTPEDAPLRPVNVYGQTKVDGERLCDESRALGAQTAIVRLSNVYGSPVDHVDRVVPAFVRAALGGGVLRVDGGDNTFDFVHVDDAVRGLSALVERLEAGARALPPIHLVTGRPTTLAELAALACRVAGTAATSAEAPARHFDVARFYGDPERAAALLGWRAEIAVADGVARLARAIRES